jgi:hypothetical protein
MFASARLVFRFHCRLFLGWKRSISGESIETRELERGRERQR